MIRRIFLAGFFMMAIGAISGTPAGQAQAGPPGQPTDWQRFYHYPYVYYPHNFQQQPESYNHMYHRYPVQRQIPVYNADWHNFYPSKKPYHSGHHFILDVF